MMSKDLKILTLAALIMMNGLLVLITVDTQMTEYHWLLGILGLLLLSAEMVTGTLYILAWFGMAMVMSQLLWLILGIDVAVQLLIYAAIFLGSLFIRQRYYKHSDVVSIDYIGFTAYLIIVAVILVF